MGNNSYDEVAARYDLMKREDPMRTEFFRRLFAQYDVKNMLDCACGTGWDLMLFHRLGCAVQGSDLSGAMLAQAERRLAEAKLDIPLHQVDFCQLEAHFSDEFDAVVCLGNSINEPLDDADTLRALCSMRAVLRPGGILVFDQGQTDATMADPPHFAPIVNERDFSRLFVMDYEERVMTVHMFDFVHKEEAREFRHNVFHIRLRLQDSWQEMLRQAGFAQIEFFGDWAGTPYDKEQSKRLIAVAQK
jgi:ubiquinone/menaquinone biosynthesis C-methylase UbiE